MTTFRSARAWLPVAFALLLAACAGTPDSRGGVADASPTGVKGALLEASLVPEPAAYQIRYFQWVDRDRQREVTAKLYLPPVAALRGPVPLVVFSHGLGGSREGYSYLGTNWAARGYASLHVQHAGSDSRVWKGNPFDVVSRLQSAANAVEAVDRVRDLGFALDRVLADPQIAGVVDPGRIVVAGHSYGANTALLAAGAVFERPQGATSFRDGRIVAAVVISAPPFHGEPDSDSIVRPIAIPTLHITATGDDIRVPGYASGYEDRVQIFTATGGRQKALVAFRDGSHSMFTDRLASGGHELNRQVKRATVDLTLAFFEEVLGGAHGTLARRSAGYDELLARLEFEPRAMP